MLGKLLKHEMKATARLLLPLFLILSVLTIMDRIVLSLKVFKGALVIIPSSITFLFVVANIAIVIVSSVLIIIRFYKNLITDEGYLMFTLPVKTSQLINAKLIISTFWTLISIAAVIASLFLVFGTAKQFDIIWDEFRLFRDEFRMEFGVNGSVFLIEMIIASVIGLICNILLIYTCIAVGQLFSGHKILGSFAAYIVIYTILQIVSSVIIILISLLSNKSMDDIKIMTQIILPLSCVLTIVFNVIFYFTTNYILGKKLNLE